ncbi:MAG: OmpA family protein [Eubacteriales bacterium]|nr:OmpA family protein [Eubacteriales bacterium]
MRRRKKTEDSGFNVWRSYSDMMAGVLLLFVLIMCITLFQAQKNYDESIQERDEKIAMQEAYTQQILTQQNELDEKNSQLLTQTNQLETQDAQLAEQQALLDQQASQLALQAEQLTQQQNTLNAQQASLDEKTALLASQQQKIDDIIGVKAEVVSALKNEFSDNNVSVNIDSKTGAMTLSANIMFDVDKAELTDEGKATLREVLPIYCKVLLDEKYKPYLAQIMIEGYTDPDGEYVYNMELSQQRSLAVAEYLVEIQDDFLNSNEQIDLQNYLCVTGCSTSDPVLDANGQVDKDASRRVEVKFRLKDDEMITELSDIMSETKS